VLRADGAIVRRVPCRRTDQAYFLVYLAHSMYLIFLPAVVLLQWSRRRAAAVKGATRY